MFTRVYKHNYTLDSKFRVSSDWQEAENKYEVLIEAWNAMVADSGNQFGYTETDFEEYARVSLESPYSTVIPYHHFLKHEDDELEPYEATKNGYMVKMLEHLADKLPDLSADFEKICDNFNGFMAENGGLKVEPEQPDAKD